jgi:hypothetical protein
MHALVFTLTALRLVRIYRSYVPIGENVHCR